MENVYRVIRRAVLKAVNSVKLKSCRASSSATAVIDMDVRLPLTVMSIREYFSEEVISLSVRTGTWSTTAIRFKVRRIEVIGTMYRLHLALAERWRDEDRLRLDELCRVVGFDLGETNPQRAHALGTEHWCMYVIGVCIHSQEDVPQPFGDQGRFVCLYNEDFVAFTAHVDDGEFSVRPTTAAISESADEVERALERHTAGLGEVPEGSTFDAIRAAEPTDEAGFRSDIEKLLASADSAFSEPESGRHAIAST